MLFTYFKKWCLGYGNPLPILYIEREQNKRFLLIMLLCIKKKYALQIGCIRLIRSLFSTVHIVYNMTVMFHPSYIYMKFCCVVAAYNMSVMFHLSYKNMGLVFVTILRTAKWLCIASRGAAVVHPIPLCTTILSLSVTQIIERERYDKNPINRPPFMM